MSSAFVFSGTDEARAVRRREPELGAELVQHRPALLRDPHRGVELRPEGRLDDHPVLVDRAVGLDGAGVVPAEALEHAPVHQGEHAELVQLGGEEVPALPRDLVEARRPRRAALLRLRLVARCPILSVRALKFLQRRRLRRRPSASHSFLSDCGWMHCESR